MFLESPRFPDDIAYGSEGGPEYKTNIVEVNSGYEHRNAVWSYPRHKFNVAYGVRTLGQLYALTEFFHAVHGSAYAFRFKHHADFKSGNITQAVSPTDQVIGTGDGAITEFPLKKTYTKGALSRARLITKPNTDTVHVALNGVEQLSGWSVDTTTGVITFDSAPGNGVSVQAGFEFDVPVRFQNDYLPSTWEDYQLLSADVPLIEVRL